MCILIQCFAQYCIPYHTVKSFLHPCSEQFSKKWPGLSLQLKENFDHQYTQWALWEQLYCLWNFLSPGSMAESDGSCVASYPWNAMLPGHYQRNGERWCRTTKLTMYVDEIMRVWTRIQGRIISSISHRIHTVAMWWTKMVYTSRRTKLKLC